MRGDPAVTKRHDVFGCDNSRRGRNVASKKSHDTNAMLGSLDTLSRTRARGARRREAMGGRKRCSHGRVKDSCADCIPCPHGKLKNSCKDCNLCPHGKRKHRCADCNPCPHGELKNRCKDCHICPHGKWKHSCAACKSARAEQPVAPEVKPDPEVKQEPFTIRGHFGLDK